MKKNMVIKAVSGYGVVDVITLKGIPVVLQFFRTQHKD
jgi:hypothetical protein